jgi:hypothetical protein
MQALYNKNKSLFMERKSGTGVQGILHVERVSYTQKV